MTGLMVPVASMTCRMSPFSTLAVKYSASVFRESRKAANIATAMAMRRIQIQFRLIDLKHSLHSFLVLPGPY